MLENCLTFHLFLSKPSDFAALISLVIPEAKEGCAADPLFEQHIIIDDKLGPFGHFMLIGMIDWYDR